MSDDSSRRWWAVLRTALTWGAAWAAVGGAGVATLALFGPNPGVESVAGRVGLAIVAGLMWSVRFGMAGAVVGTLFSTVVRLGYRGRRLADIGAARFTMLGAVVGGAGVPLYLQTMNVLSGDGPVAWNLISGDAVFGAVVGAVVAGGSILLARRGESSSPASPERIARADDAVALPAERAPDALIASHERPARTELR